jgi:hypothetical protein
VVHESNCKRLEIPGAQLENSLADMNCWLIQQNRGAKF